MNPSTRRVRKWRALNQERSRELDHATYVRNREKIIERSKQWALDNPERVRELNRKKYRAYRLRNKEKVNAYSREYARANPERFQHYARNRRVAHVTAKGSHTLTDVHARFAFHGNRCAYCNAIDDLTVEHMIPLARGGTNWPSNLVPACETCNGRKHTQTYFEFIASLERVA